MGLLSSSKSLSKPKNKGSYEEVSGYDLFYQLTYMSATASAGISRNRIFDLASVLKRPTAEYFRRVHLLSQRFGYDYARSCTMVGTEVQEDEMRSLLLRLSVALSSGQPEMDFLSSEAGVQGELYEKEYERDLSSLTLWTDAYGAIVVSVALIVIVNLISTIIYDMGMSTIVGLIFTAVMTAIGGVWVLSRSAPKEMRAFFSEEGPPAQRQARKLGRIAPFVVGTVCGLLLILGVSLGPVLIVVGLLMLPVGIIALRGGAEIDEKDREIGPFLRSLGATAMSTGTTITESITRLDLHSFPNLHRDLRRLRARLAAGIDPDLCWRKFAYETGSVLIGETVGIFIDAVKLGGDSDIVGYLASEFAAKTSMLRAKRKVVASTFTVLTITMNTVVAALMLVILEIIETFSEMIQAAMETVGEDAMASIAMPLPIFSNPPSAVMGYMTIGMVVVLSVINALAVVYTDGGHMLKTYFFLSALISLSGLCMVLVPPLISTIM